MLSFVCFSFGIDRHSQRFIYFDKQHKKKKNTPVYFSDKYGILGTDE